MQKIRKNIFLTSVAIFLAFGSIEIDLADGPSAGCFISAAGNHAGSSQLWSLLDEIRGREWAIGFVMVFLIYAGKVVAIRIKQNWRHIKIE